MTTSTTYALGGRVEAFPAGDGAIYFLRDGTTAEHVLDEPSALDRRLLELLHEARTRRELLAEAGPGGEAAVEELLGALDELGLLETADAAGPASRLDAGALARYDRQLPYVTEEGQLRLLGSTVTMIGVGALGTWTALSLACAGVGRLVLVDDDAVELGNLNRQVLFRHADVGRPKVDAAADALRAFNPDLEVATANLRVTGPADVAAVIAGSDLVVATADRPAFAIDRWVNAAAFAQHVPHVSASLVTPSVRVGPLVRPGITGCTECQHIAARREHPDHDALVAYRTRHLRPGPTIGSLSSLVGSILSNDAIHLLTGVATPATEGRVVMVDARDLTVTHERIRREPDCEVCASAIHRAA